MVPVAVSGRPFSEVALGQLRPGLVTFAEAVEWLGATPSVTVTLPDGGFLATWMFTAGTAYGVLESRMASLAFGRDGIFKRAVHLDNVRLGAAELERLKPMAVLNTRITVWP